MATKKAKNRTGRKWFNGQDKEKVISLCKEIWLIGGTDTEASSFANISNKSLSRYLAANPSIKELRDRMKETPTIKARQEVVKGLNNYQNAMDYLKRKRKNEFSERSELTGADGTKLSLVELAKSDGK